MDRTKYRQYLWAFVPINKTKSITVEANTVVFYNQGTQTVTINGVQILTPGQGFTYEGYPGEICCQAFDIVFTNDLLPGCNLCITLKEYKD